MINVEKNIISSILLSPEDIVKMDVAPEMFENPVYGQIFEMCQEWERAGSEINALKIAKAITTDFVSLEDANKILADTIDSRDSSASDEFCCREIRKKYRARKANEILAHISLNPDNVDSLLEELTSDFDSLKESEGKKAVKMSDLIKYQGDYFKEKDTVYDTGLEGIDNNIGSFDRGDLIIIAARPAVGKSAFAFQIAERFGSKGLKVGYFNLEMTAKQIYERAIAKASGINMKRIRNATNFLNDEKAKFDKGNDLLSQESNLYIYEGSFMVKDIKAEQMVNRYDAIFIDYLQLLRPDRTRTNRREEVADISKGLKRIAMDYKIPVFALSQLNRASELNKDKEPTMAELREAGDIEQDASTILMLWNPNKEDFTTKMLKVEKGRQTGNSRQILRFEGSRMTFYEEGFKEADDDMDIPFDFD